jgi:hypothetical protein
MVRTREIQLNLEMMAFKHHDGSTSSRKRDREATLYPDSSSSSSKETAPLPAPLPEDSFSILGFRRFFRVYN